MAKNVTITEDIRLCLKFWRSILTVNRGVTFAFLTDALPRCKNDVFVDASSSWGIGVFVEVHTSSTHGMS